MNEEIEKDREEMLDLLVEAEVELDAWKDRWPDVAGKTTELLKSIRKKIQQHRPEPDFEQHNTSNS